MEKFEIVIRLATDEDNEAINQQFNSCFLRDEPVHGYMRSFRSPLQHPQILRNYGLTIVAEVIDRENNLTELAGFLMSLITDLDNPITAEDFVLRTDYRVGYELYQMVCELDSKINISQTYSVSHVFDMLVLSVASEWRNMEIAKKLGQAALNMSITKGYKVAMMDCTSYYSATIAKKLGMRCIAELSYKDYQVNRGEKLFDVKEPHTHIRRFIHINEI